MQAPYLPKAAMSLRTAILKLMYHHLLRHANLIYVFINANICLGY